MPMSKPIFTALAVLLLVGAAVAQTAAPPSYRILARIAGPDGGWDLAGVDPVSGRLYVARPSGVMAVDLAIGQVTPNLVPSNRGHAALPIPGTTRVISTNGGNDTATVFEGATGQVIASLPVGKNPDAAAYDPATGSLWVMNAGSGDISVVDPASAQLVATVAVGGALELGAADGEGHLYVNVADRNEVAVIDTRARKLVTRFPLRGCNHPTGIAYAPDARLILSACANGVAKLSAPDGHEVASLAIGPRPDGALYDARRGLAFIPSGGDGTLAVISLSPKPEVVQSLETAKGARTAALDPSTGRVYLPSAQFASAVGAARPVAVPGSFAVLVVGPRP
ncbi:MAG: YncE family protein [Hyphomicrobiales bacterium]